LLIGVIARSHHRAAGGMLESHRQRFLHIALHVFGLVAYGAGF
jgi:hypothetical protein